MATLRERNNLASKKSYVKSLEQRYATDYEHAVVAQHRQALSFTEAAHWSDVPEDWLRDAGYIHDFNQRRLNRLNAVTEARNPLRDYGLDGMGKTTLPDGTVYFQALQAKYYHDKKVTASDIGSFLLKATGMYLHNPLSKGFLYTTTKLQADLRDEVRNPAYTIKHVLFPWKPLDGRSQPTHNIVSQPVQTQVQVQVPECELPLHSYQTDALAQLDNGVNALTMPCRMGKTLVAGHYLKRFAYDRIIAMAPLKISVDNLQKRFDGFLPTHASLLVDSDNDGTTDNETILAWLEENATKPLIIYTTFKSAMEVLSKLELPWDNYCIVADEVHHANLPLCEFIQRFPSSLCMTATFPAEVREALNITNFVKVSFATGLQGRFVTDYKIWLPYVTTNADGTTRVDIDSDLSNLATTTGHDNSMLKKALFLASGMLGTGSRKVIVYHDSQDACQVFMQSCAQVFEQYHGLRLWSAVLTSDTAKTQTTRQDILTAFQAGTRDTFCVLNSVRILDEAVDIPSCDSIYITSIGDTSSDIRFLQRTQRGSTIDPANPQKINNIFVWTEDGFEACLGAMTMLRDADPDFHKKLGIRNAVYSTTATAASRQEREVAAQNAAFVQWASIKCISYDEKMDRIFAAYETYVVNKKTAPPQSYVTPDGINLGRHWNHIKCGLNPAFYKDRLSKIPELKEAFEEAKKKKAESKTNDQIFAVYETYVDENETAPPFSYVTADGIKLGSHWDNTKQGKNQAFYKDRLSTIPVLKQAMEQFMQKKQTKRSSDAPASAKKKTKP